MDYPFAQGVQAYFELVVQDDYRVLRNAGWLLIRRWPLPDGSEATVWTSPDIRKFQLSRMIANAIPSHNLPGYIGPWQGEVGGEFRRGVLVHPRGDELVSSLTWRGLQIPGDATELAFGIAFDKGVCAVGAPPVRFRIEISENGYSETIFNHVLESNPCDKTRWTDFVLSLQPWQGKAVDLVISTVPAYGHNNSYDHTVWSGLEIR